MLTELFWPKEMKELVAKYRTEGTLNKPAVHNMNDNIRKHLIIGFTLSLIMFFAASYEIGILIAIAVPIVVKMDIYSLFKRQIAVYSIGEKMTATVKSFGTGLYGTQLMNYEVHAEPKSFAGRMWIGNAPRLKEEDYPARGDSMAVFFDKKGKYKAMPDIDYLKQCYCLNINNL